MIESLQSLLQPIDGADPAGPNLEYDVEYQALEEAARPGQQRENGSGVIEPEEPDWRQVDLLARPLLARSKDLRIAIHLATAQLSLDGIQGWAQGMHLIRQLLDTFWEQVHPTLDAEDDNDPTERVNVVASLASPEAMLRKLRDTRLFHTTHAGRYSLRELRIAQGILKPDDDDAATDLPSLSLIIGCMEEIPLEELLAEHASLVQAAEDVERIEAIFSEQTPGIGPDLEALQRDLRDLNHFFAPHVQARRPQPEPDIVGAEQDSDALQPVKPTRQSAIEGRDDVNRAINQICEYYARHEPSSPVPLLMRRAQRLIGMDFNALLRDLAPSGISELALVSGASGDHDDDSSDDDSD